MSVKSDIQTDSIPITRPLDGTLNIEDGRTQARLKTFFNLDNMLPTDTKLNLLINYPNISPEARIEFNEIWKTITDNDATKSDMTDYIAVAKPNYEQMLKMEEERVNTCASLKEQAAKLETESSRNKCEPASSAHPPRRRNPVYNLLRRMSAWRKSRQNGGKKRRLKNKTNKRGKTNKRHRKKSKRHRKKTKRHRKKTKRH